MQYKNRNTNTRIPLHDTREIVRLYRKKARGEKNALSREDFRKVIAACNDLLVENALNGFVSDLPCGMGRFYLIHFEHKSRKNNPINWAKTKQLWRENPEEEKKTFIRQEHTDSYTLYYDAKDCDYRHSDIVTFAASHTVKNRIRNRINQGKVNAVECTNKKHKRIWRNLRQQ